MFFTAVVRAPVTGTVRIVEPEGWALRSFLPILWACFPAMAIPTLFKVGPIYDLLRLPWIQRKRTYLISRHGATP